MNPLCKPPVLRLCQLVLVSILLCYRSDGQNIVPNSSFEDVNTCAEFSQPCSPSGWFYLSRKLTTGYYPRYPSATGSRHLHLVAASRETVNRQYWETMLLCPLQPGEKYIVSIKVAAPANPPNLSGQRPNLRDIGLWFAPHFFFVQGDSILQPRSFLSFTGSSAKDLKNGWFELRKEFTATVASSVLIVGNFARSANADILEQRNWTGESIDILVDDVVVSPVKNFSCSDAGRIKDTLYGILWRHSDSNTGEETALLKIPRPMPVIPIDSSRIATPPDTPKTVERPKPVLPPSKSGTDTIVLHNIQFDFDKYTMQNPDTLQRYRSLFIRPGIKKIQVVGYTDDVGSAVYNKDLSTKRAKGIAGLLTSKFQIPAEKIEAEGKGISRTFPTRELNRRVEIYIFHE